MNREISVITPVWNGKADLICDVPALLSLKGVCQWVFADDASADGSGTWLEQLAASHPKNNITVLRSSKNLGFPVNVNRAAAEGIGKYLAVINPDLAVCPNTLEQAMRHFAKPDIAGVTFREEGKGGWGILRWQGGWAELSSGEVTKRSHESGWGSGGGTIYRRDVWDCLGGYDPLYSPGYWEDVDFGYRLRKRGWKIIWEPAASVTHAIRETTFRKRFSTGELKRIQERNRLLFIWKNVTQTSMVADHLQALKRRTLAHPGYLRIIAAALLRFTEVKKRREIERKEAILTDEEIFERFPR